MATYNLPPIVNYSYPAFVDNIRIPIEYPIDFNTTPGTSVGFQYKIINNSSNYTVIGDSNSQYTGYFWPQAIEIPANAFDGAGIYKIQLRFKVLNDAEDYSEWSSVCYTKKLERAPEIYIKELNTDADVESKMIYDSPTFTGIYQSEEEEPLEYQFSLYYATNGAKKIATTGWKKHIPGQFHIGKFPILLTDFTRYKVKYEVKTVNGYQQGDSYLSVERLFLTAFYEIQDDIGLTIHAKNNYDDGVIAVHISGNQKIAGNLMLRRASEKTNYQNWEDLQYLQVLNKFPNITYNDFTVEHGTQYQYGIQVINQENGVEYRSNLKKSNKEMAEFEDIFLVSNNEQIKIKFNPKVTNFKRNLLEQKQDTIGSQYPYIMKNGNSNYFSFSLGGLISYFADNNNSTLFRDKTKTSRTEDNLIDVRTTNLTDRNIYNERQYREKIEQFLTNGEAKLFKSPTEGNMLIYLMQVSLTPNDTLSRMIYSFTSTAYEIGSVNSSEDLLKYKIFNKGQWIAVSDMGTEIIPLGNYYVISVTSAEEIIDKLNQQLVEITSADPCTPQILNFQSIDIKNNSNKDVAIIINGVQDNRIVVQAGEEYHLPEGAVSITQLNTEASATLYISGVATVSYISNTVYTKSNEIKRNMVSVTNIGQILPPTTENSQNEGSNIFTADTNLGDVVARLNGLTKFFSFTYLKIRGIYGQDFEVQVDGNIYKIFNNQDRYFTEPIREFIIKVPEGKKISFYADFVYNGYKYQ